MAPGLMGAFDSLGIEEVGETTARNLAMHFGDFNALSDATFEELLTIQDIGPRVASKIKDYFSERGAVGGLDTTANTFMQNAANSGLGALEGSAKYLNTSRDLLGVGGAKPGLNLATLKAAGTKRSRWILWLVIALLLQRL